MIGEDRLTSLALLHTKYNMPLDLGAITSSLPASTHDG